MAVEVTAAATTTVSTAKKAGGNADDAGASVVSGDGVYDGDDDGNDDKDGGDNRDNDAKRGSSSGSGGNSSGAGSGEGDSMTASKPSVAAGDGGAGGGSSDGCYSGDGTRNAVSIGDGGTGGSFGAAGDDARRWGSLIGTGIGNGWVGPPLSDEHVAALAESRLALRWTQLLHRRLADRCNDLAARAARWGLRIAEGLQTTSVGVGVRVGGRGGSVLLPQGGESTVGGVGSPSTAAAGGRSTMLAKGGLLSESTHRTTYLMRGVN
ncbi:unnamed protein product [Phaeothamnion confervicola]